MGKTPKPRWFQFSLKALLVAMTLASVALAWLAYERNEVRKREAAIVAIEKLGGQVEFDEARPFRPIWIKPLLGDNSVRKVVRVNFFSNRIPDAGQVHLVGLTELRELYLNGTQATDARMTCIASMTELERLSLDSTQVTDAGLIHLAGLTNLKYLNLNRTQITDAGIVHIASLVKLEELYIDNTQVTDVGLDHLTGLTELKELRLSNTLVTDSGLARLAGLTKLKELHLGGTHVTYQRVQAFSKALPNIVIIP